jgi:hypothetical protein
MRQAALNAHYERADKLGAADFLDREDKAKQYLGGFYDFVIDVYPEMSEQIIYDLGGDKDKCIELLQAASQHAGTGARKLNDYVVELKTKFNQSSAELLPEPDEPIQGGAGGVHSKEALIEKSRKDKMSGKITMEQHMDNMRKYEAL